MTTKHILFVCTGNTCRSPMAQAIAESVIGQRSLEDKITVDSAGVAAEDGYSASPEAIDTLAERKIDLTNHQSKMLTPEMVQDADVIYTMTPRHAQAIIQEVPEASAKVFPLDSLQPIGDPIGGPIEVYREVADHLEKLIQAKIKEIVS